jgi:hypothetical protein
LKSTSTGASREFSVAFDWYLGHHWRFCND